MPPMTKAQYKQTLWMEWVTLAFYRDLAAEFISTFFLTMSATTLGMNWGKENMGTVVQVAYGMGCTVCSLAWGLIEFGGIHMNPTVTFAMTVLREMTITKALLFIGIQIAAATAAASVVKAVFPSFVTEAMSPTVLHPAVTPWQGFLTEIWLTFYLILTVLGSSDGIRKRAVYVPPLIISMTVTTAISSGFTSTGCSMNPALTMGPAIVTNIWDDHWVYWAGPLAGTVLAIVVYKVLFDMVDRRDARPRMRKQYYSVLNKNFKKNL